MNSTPEAGIDALVALDMDALRCPYPAFDAVREEAPIWWSESMGSWIVTDYELLKQVLHDTDSFSNRAAGGPQAERSGMLEHIMALAAEPEHAAVCERFIAGLSEAPSVLVFADPPAHVRQRRLVNKAFRPSALRAMEPAITSLVDGLLDDMLGPVGQPHAATVSLDLVPSFSVPVPLTVIANALGVPEGDHDAFKFWSDSMLVALGNAHVSREQALAFVTGTVEFNDYFAERLAERADEPRGDLISDVATAELDGDRLGDLEQLGMVRQFLLAGNETTTKLLSNAVRELAERPELQARVRAEPALVPALIEESLRCESPVTGLFRTAVRDTSVGGVMVKEGQYVWAAYSAANRDPDKFDQPGEFQLGRFGDSPAAADHLAFGHGEHFCLGAALARTEARIALGRLLARTSDIRLTPGANDFAVNHSFVLRGIEQLHVDIDIAAA